MNLTERVKYAIHCGNIHSGAEMCVPEDDGSGNWIYLDDLLEEVLPELEKFDRLRELLVPVIAYYDEYGYPGWLDTVYNEIAALCKEEPDGEG